MDVSLFRIYSNQTIRQHQSRFLHSIQQKPQHPTSLRCLDVMFQNNVNATKLRRKSCYCEECGQLSKFQFRQLNLKQHIQQNKLRKSITTYGVQRPLLNSLSIQIPNPQLKKSITSIKISKKPINFEKQEHNNSPLILYNSQYQRTSVCMKMLEQQQFRRTIHVSHMHSSRDSNTPLSSILQQSSQQKMVDSIVQTMTTVKPLDRFNSKLNSSRKIKFMTPDLKYLGKSTKFKKFEMKSPKSQKMNHNRIQTLI